MPINKKENEYLFLSYLAAVLPAGHSAPKTLKEIGFFEAPASHKYHHAYEGGLVEHSLSVLHWFGRFLVTGADAELKKPDYLIKISIISLLHDVCKSGCYKKEVARVKTENDEWIETTSYKFVEEYPMGHGEKSLDIIANELKIELSREERLAIRWHMGPYGLSYQDLQSYNLALKNSRLVFPLHTADMMSTLYERENNDFLKKMLSAIPF